MFRWPGFWDVATCARIRAAMDRGLSSPGEVIAAGYVVDERARVAEDIEIDLETCAFAEREMARLTRRLAGEFGVALSGFEGPAFLRYLQGGRYGPHRDSGASAEGRLVSVSLFLNSAGPGAHGFSGGALRVYGGANSAAVDVIPEAGTVIAFRSDTVHEVLPVTCGVRDAMVTWFLAPAQEAGGG